MSNYPIGDIHYLHEMETERNMLLDCYQECDCGNPDCEGCDMGDMIAEAHVDETKIKRGEEQC